MKIMIFFYILAQIFTTPSALAENFSGDSAKKVKEEVKGAILVPAKEETTAVEVQTFAPIKQAAVLKVEATAPVKQMPVLEKKIVPDVKKNSVISQTVSAPVEPAVSSAEPEVLTKFKAIQAQEAWVGKLKKQLDGETSQLNEMRKSMAESFGLDAKKLESGSYRFDPKSGKFVEK